MKDITNLVLLVVFVVLFLVAVGKFLPGKKTEEGSGNPVEEGTEAVVGGGLGGILNGIGGVVVKSIEGLGGLLGISSTSWQGNTQNPSSASDLNIVPLPYGAPPQGLNTPGGYEIYGDGPPVQGSPA